MTVVCIQAAEALQQEAQERAEAADARVTSLQVLAAVQTRPYPCLLQRHVLP